MITQFNDRELSALYGLPLAARVLYLTAIRPYMDYSTGVVGVKRGISLNSLAETLYVEPHKGMKEGVYSRDQVKRLVYWLERNGLVERQSLEREKLIFFLPMADRDEQVQKKAATYPPHSRPSKAATVEPSNDAGCSDKAATYPPQSILEKAATPPYNRISVSLSNDKETYGFSAAWAIYPKREGSNPKRDAEKFWNARIKEGVTEQELLDGVKRYSAHCFATGITGTSYVMQAKRFFGNNREYENEWAIKNPGDGQSQNRGSLTNGGNSTAKVSRYEQKQQRINEFEAELFGARSGSHADERSTGTGGLFVCPNERDLPQALDGEFWISNGNEDGKI